ncbi:hypothetical protein MBLNU459_g2047t1 [Dothideomycetes sp. NU459]
MATRSARIASVEAVARLRAPPPPPTLTSRSSTTRPSHGHHLEPRACRSSHSYRNGLVRAFSTRSCSREQGALRARAEDAPGAPSKAAARKPARSQAPTSLRRVAVEAQRSRHGFIRRSGRRQFVDPDAATKEVAAYCAAEQYNIPVARRLLKQEGYDVDPCHTGLYPQVIHARTPNYLTTDPESGKSRPQGCGDIFVFPSGTAVAWNVPERVSQTLVNRVLLLAAENSHPDTVEVEDLEYLEDASRDTSQIVAETIILGTKASSSPSSLEDSSQPDIPASPSSEQSEVDTILAKIAFSSGLARSTKLAVLENLLSSYFHSTRTIPLILSRGSKLRFTRSFILRKTGELLSIRAQLNLYSELTDSLPDLFWDSPSSLGLSDYYDEVGRALDVEARIKVLNEKMDYASEIASVLRERLSEKHSTGLEWLIIFLISVEVGFELRRMWRDRMERNDPDSTEALLREVLLQKKGERTD